MVAAGAGVAVPAAASAPLRRRLVRLISLLTKDSAPVTKSSGPTGVPVLPPAGAVTADATKLATAAVGRAATAGTVAGAIEAAAAVLTAGVTATGVATAVAGRAGGVNDAAAWATDTSGTGPPGCAGELLVVLRCAAAAAGAFRPRGTRFAGAAAAVCSRAPERGVADVDDVAVVDAESSADATHGVTATKPPMPRAMASAPTRPMSSDACAGNTGSLSKGTLVTGVTKANTTVSANSRFTVIELTVFCEDPLKHWRRRVGNHRPAALRDSPQPSPAVMRLGQIR